MQERRVPNDVYLAALQNIADEISLLRKALKPEKKQLTEEDEKAVHDRIISDVFGD